MNANAKKRGTLFLSALASGVMLFLSFPSFNLYLTVWFALVPIMAVCRHRPPMDNLYAGMIVFFVALCGGFPWLNYLALHYMNVPTPFHNLAIVVYALYMAVLGGSIFFVSQWVCTRVKLSYCFVFPSVFVAFWHLYPMLFYFRLGGSQFYFKTAIQPIEYVGVYGLDFVIVLVNVLITESVLNPNRFFKRPAMTAGWAVVIGWFLLGTWRYAVWDKKIQGWDTEKIAIIQSNRPIGSGLGPVPRPLELEMSVRAAKKHANVAVWPEGAFHGFDYYRPIRDEFLKTARDNNIALIINDRSKAGEDSKNTRVSSFMIKPDGVVEKYDKQILVPFGETLPFNGLLRPIVDALGIPAPHYKSGNRYAHFEHNDVKYTPLICYENIFPEHGAGAIGSDGAGKVFIFQSQDGWYGSAQQAEQHLNTSFMRAVENRVPAIHVINNGVSGAVTPHGEIMAQTTYAKNELNVFDLPVDKKSGGTFYSRYPNVFPNAVTIFVMLLGLYTFYSYKTDRRASDG